MTFQFRQLLCFAVIAILLCSSAGGEDKAAPVPVATTSQTIDLAHKPVPRLKPGIVIGQEKDAGYSDLVTIVFPRLASGDIDSLPEFARHYASMFKFTVLANVLPHQRDGQTDYLLEKVGIGFAMDINGKTVVVTKDTANSFGADLGMIDRGVLGGNEDCLEDVVQVARTKRLIIFDAEANMLIGEDHKKRVIRHLIWASPGTGKIGFLVWLMKENGAGDYEIVAPNMQLLPPGLREDRKIHVSNGGILSRIPTPDRFALVTIPQGREIPFSQAMKRVAGKKKLSPADLTQLVNAAGQSLASTSRRRASGGPGGFGGLNRTAGAVPPARAFEGVCSLAT